MEPARPDKLSIILAAVLVVAVLLLYLPVLHHQFIMGLDDDVYLVNNAHVNTGFTLANLKWALTSTQPFYWHPLTWMSHLLDYTLFGLNAGAHHYVNVLLHAANALLLFVLLLRATGARWRSFVAAALFAIHPLNVETVAWAAERKSLLSLLFSLLTVAAYGWYAQRPAPKRYLVVLAGFALALMCKPAAVTLPAVLFVLDFWPLKRWARPPDHAEIPPMAARSRLSLVWEKLPLFGLGAAISAVTISGGHAAAVLVPFSVLPLSTRLQTALLSYSAYLGKALWPAGLAVFHPHPATYHGLSLPTGDVLAAAVLLGMVTGVAIYFVRPAPFLLAGWAMYLVTMLPMIGIIQTGYQGIQEHFTYVPGIGIYIMLAWGLAKLAQSFPVPRLLPQLISLVWLACLSAVSIYELGFWRDGVSLFGHARQVERSHPWLEQLYAGALRTAGRNEEALQHFQTACAQMPMNEFCHKGIADVLFDRQQYDAALSEYGTALMITKNRAVAGECLVKSAEALLRLGSVDAARGKIAEALALNPDDATAKRLSEQIANRGGRR